VAGVTFASFENLTGGTLDDVYLFADGVGVDAVIDGEDGTDTLDYSAYTTPAAVDLLAGTATGTGGIEDIEGCLDCTLNLLGRSNGRAYPRSQGPAARHETQQRDTDGPDPFDGFDPAFDIDAVAAHALNTSKPHAADRDGAVDELMQAVGDRWWNPETAPSKPVNKRRFTR